MAPIIVPQANGVFDAESSSGSTSTQAASLLMSTEAGAETLSIVDNTPGEHGLEACKILAQRFDSASAPAQANLNSMSRTFNKPPKGKVDNIEFLIGTSEDIFRRQDEEDRPAGID